MSSICRRHGTDGRKYRRTEGNVKTTGEYGRKVWSENKSKEDKSDESRRGGSDGSVC